MDMDKSVTSRMQCSPEELFAAWANGVPSNTLVSMSGLPLVEIQELARCNDWLRALQTLPGEKNAKGGRGSRIEENRETNLRLFGKLRNALEKAITELEAGTLKLEKVSPSKAGPIIVEHAPGTSDIVNLARALQIVSEGSAKCLGDTAVVAQPRTIGNAQSAEGQVIVMIPSVLSKESTPRVSQIVDVPTDP